MRTLAALCLALAPAAALAQVEPGEAPDIPAAKDSSLDEFQRKAELDRGAAKGNDRASRLALEAYGACVVKNSPGEASRLLAMDFTTPTYERGLRKLSDSFRDQCVDKAVRQGSMRSSNLLFAGELAEALLERESAPVGSRLAKAAAGPATPSFSFTDKVAICVVRSAPDQVAALFATARDSAEETAAITGLTTVTGLCAKAAEAKKPLEINPAGLRAMLATAAFRSVKSSEVPA